MVQTPDESEGWSPPEGSQTLEGRFHFTARDEGDDLADVVALLRSLFEGAYWTLLPPDAGRGLGALR